MLLFRSPSETLRWRPVPTRATPSHATHAMRVTPTWGRGAWVYTGCALGVVGGRSRLRRKAGSLPLLPDEAGAILMLPSITTVTFYEGSADVEILRGMTEELIRANPWLAGQLRRDKATGSVNLWVPNDVQDLSKHFTKALREDLEMQMPLMRMRATLKNLTVKPGLQCVDVDEPLFSVALVGLKTKKMFALVISLSHVLGDGFTYYRLFGALDQRPCEVNGTIYQANQGPARARLNPWRKPDFPQAVAQALGPQQAWPSSRFARWGSLLDAMMRPKHRWHAWYVDATWLKGEKQRFQDEQGGFVSSNDVLTSWFFTAGNFDYGIMSVNFRGRLCGLDKTHAGNYKAGLAFWPSDFASPQGIRRSLRNPPYFRAERQDVPGFVRSVTGRVGVATNWASVFQELHLQNCQQLLHLPVLGDVQVHGAMIIFRPQPDRLGIVLGERKRRPRRPSMAVSQAIC